MRKKAGGRTTGTIPPISSWNHIETTTIRIPTALKEEILLYARQLDKGHTPNVPLNNAITEGASLKLLAEFIAEIKRKEQMVPLMGWKMIIEFRYWILKRVKNREHKLRA